ncbi:MAG: MFS transporter [Alphaproteobacteria bacterium]|nr:MFS transporter [Alphaproteobacteria bacterium]
MFYGWFVVGGSFTTLFIAFGAAYSFTAFFDQLQGEFSASRASVSLIFSIGASLYFGLGAVSGAIADRINARWVIAAGMFLLGVGLFWVSRAESLTEIYLGYGLGIGVGIGFAYAPAMGAVQRWFVKRRGLASGLAVSGIGLGTAVVPPLVTALIHWSDWRSAYLVLAAVAMIGGVAAALLIESSPARRGQFPDGAKARGPAGPSGPPGDDGLTLAQALRSKPFWVLYVAGLLASIGISMPFVHMMPFVQDLGLGKATGAAMLGLIGLASTIGRFLVGAVADRIGRRRALIGINLGLALAAAWWAFSTTTWQLSLFAVVFGICYGGFVALSPAVTADYFSVRSISAVIGAGFTAASIAMFAGPILAGYAFDVMQSYWLPLSLSAGLALVAALAILLIEEPEAWRRMRAAQEEAKP